MRGRISLERKNSNIGLTKQGTNTIVFFWEKGKREDASLRLPLHHCLVEGPSQLKDHYS
ncbi:hypothetical protein LguiA_029998 [Lonicera macranthoides]